MIEKISDILIVSDIDGTLLWEANGLSEENRAAIKRFTDKMPSANLRISGIFSGSQ